VTWPYIECKTERYRESRQRGGPEEEPYKPGKTILEEEEENGDSDSDSGNGSSRGGCGVNDDDDDDEIGDEDAALTIRVGRFQQKFNTSMKMVYFGLI